MLFGGLRYEIKERSSVKAILSFLVTTNKLIQNRVILPINLDISIALPRHTKYKDFSINTK
jgi:hypothetical protein